MKQIPLKNLKSYLESLQNNNSVGEGALVDIGHIVQNKNPWYKRYGTIAILCSILFTGILAYQNSFTIIVSANNIDSKEISDIVYYGGGRTISVQEENNNYKIRLFTFKNINTLLDALRKNKDLKKVELSN